MPSTKKRVNLTLSDEVYERLQVYKSKYGLSSDATACLQLIVQQLNGLERTELMLNYISQNSVEALSHISNEGFSMLKGIRKDDQPNS